MKYGELIQFEPVESVVRLQDSEEEAKAASLIKSYVFSEEIAQRLIDILIPQLQFTKPADNKALLVIGNYGSGKSHLLSVVSSVAERSDLAQYIQNNAVRTTMLNDIAGQFKVVRAEIGTTKMTLREIIVDLLESHLNNLGVSYRFPDPKTVTNYKDAFEDMMTAFEAKHPNTGLLLVLDELLEFLLKRKDQEFIDDLGILREIGEVARDLKFRFIGGVQESVFAEGRFQHAAQSLQRVKARFEQIVIAQRDIRHVVAERVLRKTPEQRATVRKHLEPFSKFYAGMSERLDEFAHLFPVHPDYLDTFERVSGVEKRQALQTISQAIRKLIDKDVPGNDPGLLAYDSYWQVILDDPSFRAVPTIKDVIECSTVLEGRVRNAFPRPQYKPAATRIIRALSVQRLTTGGTGVPIGPSAAELRDGLLLYEPTISELGGKDPAADLLTHVSTVLKLIHQTVNGQFIAFNPENGQYYIDLNKTADFDALIDKRAGSLDDEMLDRGYYDALQRAMGLKDETYMTGYKIWEHNIEWLDRKAHRTGYLFFGARNERSTAAPPRDFYIYFMPFATDVKNGEKSEPDEVYFKLTGADPNFKEDLKRYAAAVDLAMQATDQSKVVYGQKANACLKSMVTYLQTNFNKAYKVSYRASTKEPNNWLHGSEWKNKSGATFQELVDATSSVCLAEHFLNQATDYPRFGILTTADNRAQAAQDAIRNLSQTKRTTQANAILDALELVDDGRIEPEGSRYARYMLDALKGKGTGQVVNRSELMQSVNHVEYFAPEKGYRLEPEWVAVLLAALVYNGNIVLNLPGKAKLDAGSFAELVKTPVSDIVAFKHLELPKEWNPSALRALFSLLGLEPGLGVQVTQGGKQGDEAVSKLQSESGALSQRLAVLQARLNTGLVFWHQNLLKEHERTAVRKQVEELKAFSESLQAFNTPAKLKNFKYSEAELLAMRDQLGSVMETDKLREIVEELRPLTEYLATAENVLPPDDAWQAEMRRMRDECIALLRELDKRSAAPLRQKLSELKKGYIAQYLALHGRARLDSGLAKRRDSLQTDARFRRLNKLAYIELLPRQDILDFGESLEKMKECSGLTPTALDTNPVCQQCGFRPATEKNPPVASQTLSLLDNKLDELENKWTQQLLGILGDPATEETVKMLEPAQRSVVQMFRDRKSLPDEVDTNFIETLKEASKGLDAVELPAEDLVSRLFESDTALRPEVLQKRFDEYVASLTRGKQADRVRFVLQRKKLEQVQ